MESEEFQQGESVQEAGVEVTGLSNVAGKVNIEKMLDYSERTQSDDAAGGSSPGLQVKAAQTNKVKRSYNAVRN